MAEARSRDRYLQALGIERWQLRRPRQDAAAAEISAATPASDGQVVKFRNPAAPSGNQPAMDWDSLARCVADCTRCNLHGGRTQTVFGVGDRAAQWMIIGEAPGAEEDARGEPFVGRAGQLLNAMLQAIGLQREQVYIANILKCRPPKNRDPLPEEAQQCWPYLKRQIELVAPKVILAVGRIAAQNLLLTDQAIGRLRGKIHTHAESGIPMVVTYHPAYLLRTPSEKRKAWEDLRLACRAMEQARS
ncbi:MAG TPA: uracil-DNA glycosylase family protein [Gammaproteobacteria bacterium]|nr:uracil-DNA glycosylase family protein [Gammaproteobacteria bacterium]